MARRSFTLAIAGVLALASFSWSAANAAESPEPSDPGGLSVYTGVVDASALSAIVELGVDRHELEVSPVDGSTDQFNVEVILSGEQAASLAAEGAELAPKDAASRRTAASRGRSVQAVQRRRGHPGGDHRAGVRVPRHRRGPHHRPDRQRTGHHRHPRDEESRPRAPWKAPDHRVSRGSARSGVDHPRDGHADFSITSSPATEPTRRSPDSSTRTNSGSSRSPIPTATTTPTTSSGCGERTSATTTATDRSHPATVSTSTGTSPPAGATTTRARRRISAVRPTAEPVRCPSRRTRHSTRCSGRSRPSS